MKITITNLLNAINNYLLKLQFPVSNSLDDGLAESEIKALFSRVNLSPSGELIELYQWRNGTRIVRETILDDIQIIPGFYFLRLQDSVDNYQAMKSDKRWNKNWFPIFANGGGDFYAVDLSQIVGNTSPIVGFILGEAEQEIEYQSLAAMLLTFCECFERNIIFRTQDGYLEMDDEEQAIIALKHNPDVKFWHC